MNCHQNDVLTHVLTPVLFCRVFSDGGNFCPEEIETYKSRLETIAIKVDKCEGTVMSDLEGIEAKRLELATKIVAEFEERFNAS